MKANTSFRGFGWHPFPRMGAGLLTALALFCASGAWAENADRSVDAIIASDGIPHCCVTPGAEMCRQNRGDIQKTLLLLRAAGTDMLRLAISWRDLERAPGGWSAPLNAAYLEEARNAGFRIKMIVGTMMGPPKWYLDAHPDARITDESGDVCKNTLDPWYPNLRPALAEALDRQMQYLAQARLLEQIDVIVVDTGPAGEPIYPANYQVGRQGADNTFWCYSRNAQADFRAKTAKKYSTLASLNTAWGTSYGKWEDVSVPQPRTVKGKHWEDVLLWYRDVKREFVTWQVRNFKRGVAKYGDGKISLLLYLPGSQVRPIELQDAIETGEGCNSVKIMADTRFLVQLAAAEGLWVQHTGANNRSEMGYIVKLLGQAGLSPKHLWGENAGTVADPLWLMDNIMYYGLWGCDYTHATHVFERDLVTPNERYADLATALKALHTGQRLGFWLADEPQRIANPQRGETTLLLPSVADATVVSRFPNMRKGERAELSVLQKGVQEISLLKFDFGQAPPQARLLSATLRLTLERGGKNANLPVDIYRVTQDWDEDEVTWNSPDGHQYWKTKGVSAADARNAPVDSALANTGQYTPYARLVANGAAPGTEYRWDVTALVKAWQAGTLGNHGLLVTAAAAREAALVFASREHQNRARRPVLEIRCAQP